MHSAVESTCRRLLNGGRSSDFIFYSFEFLMDFLLSTDFTLVVHRYYIIVGIYELDDSAGHMQVK